MGSMMDTPPWDEAAQPASTSPAASPKPSKPTANALTPRAAFEEFFLESRRGRGRKHLPTFALLPDGTYADDHTQRHWWTWQRASLAMREACALICEARAVANDATGNRASVFGAKANSGLQMAVRASEDRACAKDIRELEVDGRG